MPVIFVVLIVLMTILSISVFRAAGNSLSVEARDEPAMKLWQRALFAALIVLVNIASLVLFLLAAALGFLVVEGFVTQPRNAVAQPAGFVVEVLVAWLAVSLVREAIRPARRGCSITAVTVAVVFDVAVLAVLLNSDVWPLAPSLWIGLCLLLTIPLMHFMVLLFATYWRSSRVVRSVETSVAVSMWVVFLFLRGFSLWQFAPSGQLSVEVARMDAVAMLVATAPLLIVLLIAFWRDRDSVQASLVPALSPPASA